MRGQQGRQAVPVTAAGSGGEHEEKSWPAGELLCGREGPPKVRTSLPTPPPGGHVGYPNREEEGEEKHTFPPGCCGAVQGSEGTGLTLGS